MCKFPVEAIASWRHVWSYALSKRLELAIPTSYELYVVDGNCLLCEKLDRAPAVEQNL